jgi:C1A family cysteine protease
VAAGDINETTTASQQQCELVTVEDSGSIVTFNNPEITVGDSSSGSFSELQTQINNIEEGGVLNLSKDYQYADGSTEGVRISKPITINGNGYVLDAKGQSRIFNITSDNVTLKNITFVNAGGVSYGAAVYCSHNNLSIINSSFINNSALISGGAVYLKGDSYNNEITNCNFENNTAKTSGGAFEGYLSEIIFENVTFTCNKASQGAGIMLQYSISIFENCTFDKNEAEKSAGALYAYYSLTSLDNCEITNNRVNGKYPFGGAIAYFAFENNITNTLIRNNSIEGDFGYGSSIYNYGRLNIRNSQIEENRQKTKNYIEDTVFTNNGIVNSFNNTFVNNTIESGNESVIYALFWPLVYDKIFDENTTIPTSLDLRTVTKDNGTVEEQFKPIQDQGISGGCWAFSATSIIEYYFKSHYGGDYAFSENNLINIMGPYGKDGWTVAKGGGTAKSVAYWARWSGPVNASDDPFDDSSKISPDNLAVMGHLQDVLYITCGDITQLKLAILEYGPVVIGYKYYDPEVTCQNGTYIESIDSPINLLPRYSNHLVSIVGWDDNYPGSSFAEGLPDGAFLIRNSFGEEFFDKNLYETVFLEGEGYNWISYYDLTLSTESIAYAIVNVEGTDNYNHNYQYDTKGTLISMGYNSDSSWFANQFKATDNSPLAAFSLYTFVPNSTYEAYIYVNDKLSYSQNGSISNPGYNTIKLNSLVDLNRDDIFRIAIKLTCPGFIYPIALETADSSMITKTNADLNQSFVSPDGINWYDISQATDVLYMELGSLSYKKMNDTNVCIKAFTSKLNTTIVAGSVTTVYNGRKYLTVTLTDSKNRPISGRNVSVMLNGRTILLITDSKGQVKLSTDNLEVKTYTATIVFGGDGSYGGSAVDVKITVKKATPKLTAKAKKFKKSKKVKKYSVTLKSNQNKAMKKTWVTLKVNKKVYKAKTNTKGKVTFKIKNLNKKCKVKAKITYKGDKYYNKVSKKVKITVK